MFYETIDDITADAGIRVRGDSKEEVICKAILATFNEITDIEKVQHREKRVITERGKFPFILADIINRALLLHERDRFVASSCHIPQLSDESITAELVGEPFDPDKHISGLVIKAATYHRLRFEKEGNLWIAEVIFDI